MKKLLFTLIIIAGTTFSASAQGPKAVKVSPFTFLKGQALMLHYEHNIFNSITIGAGVAPVLWGPILGSLSYPPSEFNTGVAIDPEIRWYAKSDQVMDGFFVGLYNSNRFSSWYSGASSDDIWDWEDDDSYDIDGYDVTNRKIIVGLQLGVQKLLGEHFCFDFYSGLGFQGNVTTATGRTTNYVNTVEGGGINLRCNISIGWQF
tara:strand:+ start:121 stop:732 length:612 start_codon:yes stop_codon:yes gene_type:complete